jgi:plastocyanin
MKKRRLSILALCLSIVLSFAGCSSDDDDFKDVDGQSPSISLTADHVQTEIGREFTIKGTIQDKDGIRSIRLMNTALNLDKTIDLLEIYEEHVYSYDLSYKFKTPKTQTGESFPIQVTVTDLGGRVTEATVLITMDGDFTNPIFVSSPDAAVTVLLKETTRLNLRFSVEDDKALDFVEVSIPELNIEEKVMADGKILDYSKSIELPSVTGTYNLTIKAVDKFNLETVRNSVITVSEMPDFPKMYLSDVSDAAKLNSDLFGIPMLIDHTGEYTYKAKYYSEAPGTEVRFVPQKTDFQPICFGINPDDKSILTDEPDLSLPIVLAEKGYYEIEFNVKTGAYSTKRYTPTDTPVEIGKKIYLNDGDKDAGMIPLEIGLAGVGLPGAGNWAPGNPLMLTQSTDNPFILYAEMTLEAGTSIEFTITPKHDWGWWLEPFWRFDNSGEMEANVLNGGDNMKKVTVKKDGKYMFKFDTHLLRSRFYPVN